MKLNTIAIAALLVVCGIASVPAFAGDAPTSTQQAQHVLVAEELPSTVELAPAEHAAETKTAPIIQTAQAAPKGEKHHWAGLFHHKTQAALPSRNLHAMRVLRRDDQADYSCDGNLWAL